MERCFTEVDSACARVLGADWDQRVRRQMHRIADHPFDGTPTGAVLDRALDTSGKMLRAKLLLLCGTFGPEREEKRERLHTLAAMTELTHLASLIHDDIVDQAEFRRGKPSVQSRFGKDAAVYAGDYLMARIQYIEATERMNEASAVLAAAIERMCAGEISQAMCRYRPDTTIAQYFANISGKTVALFQAACRIGAMESGCGGELIQKLACFGEHLGVLFQLRDDFLDFTADAAELGKATHKDLRDGIYSLPVLLALRHPEGRGKLLPVMEKNAREGLSEREVAYAEEIIVSLGGVEAAHAEICRRQKKLEALLTELPQCGAAELLQSLAAKLTVSPAPAKRTPVEIAAKEEE